MKWGSNGLLMAVWSSAMKKEPTNTVWGKRPPTLYRFCFKLNLNLPKKKKNPPTTGNWAVECHNKL